MKMQLRNWLTGPSRRSWVAVTLCLAHALAVRLAIVITEIPSVHQWMNVPYRPYGLAILVAVKLIALAWLVWLVALWPLIDKGRRHWVPIILAVGFAFLGWEAIQFVILLAAWLLEHGNLGN